MKRELKFRIWNGEKFILEPRLSLTMLNCEPFHCDVISFGNKIQQYTGYKDEDGEYIFDGDFVKITDIRQSYVIQVSWNDLRLCVDGRRKIIGNIFENPELLKGS